MSRHGRPTLSVGRRRAADCLETIHSPALKQYPWSIKDRLSTSSVPAASSRTPPAHPLALHVHLSSASLSGKLRQIANLRQSAPPASNPAGVPRQPAQPPSCDPNCNPAAAPFPPLADTASSSSFLAVRSISHGGHFDHIAGRGTVSPIRPRRRVPAARSAALANAASCSGTSLPTHW